MKININSWTGQTPFITAPWYEEIGGVGYVCATDGRMALTIRADAVPPVPECDGHPKMAPLVVKAAQVETTPIPWEQFILGLVESGKWNCQYCNRTGTLLIEEDCPNCGGMGTHHCRKCNESHPCGACHGTGSVGKKGIYPCPACNGTKSIPGFILDSYPKDIHMRSVITPAGVYADMYLLRLFHLDDVTVFVPRMVKYEEAMLYFEHACGMAMLMPIHSEEKAKRVLAANAKLFNGSANGA